MKWAVRSMFGLVIGGCVVLAILVGPLSEFVTENLAYWPGADRCRDSASVSDPAGTTDSLVAAMHVHNRTERDNIVARIRDEFGIQVAPDRFSSHHTAGDYLERLRLARQAEAVGLDLDPDAFGDDEFMRRHIEALRPGAAAGLLNTALPASEGGALALGRSAAPDGRDYIFVYGRRYYPNGYGAYVRDDGTVLDLVGAKRPRQRAAEAKTDDAGQIPALSADALSDLDTLLDVLLTRTAGRPCTSGP